MNIAVSAPVTETLIEVEQLQDPVPRHAGAMSQHRLVQENCDYQGTSGLSEANRSEGFLPAFQDLETGKVYLSRTRDGRQAPFHLLDGLDEEVVLERSTEGRVTAVKASVISGFVRQNRFYTRDQAAANCA